MKSLSLLLVTALLGLNEVKAAVPQWGQCGGINYTGDTKCVAGCVCVYLNDWYYQCLAAAPTSSSTTTTKKSSTSTKPTSTTKSTSTKTTSTKTTSTKTTSTKTTSTKTTSTKTSTTKTSTKSTSTSTSSVTRTTLTSTSSVTRSTVSSTSSATRTCATSTSTPTSTLLPLNDLAVAAGKQYFGVAVGYNQYSNATYKANLDNTHLFGQVTPENEMKWDATEPTQGVFSYTNADAIVDWALCDGKEVRGHTLVWHSQLPSWITSGTFDNSTLVSIMQNHITNLVTHFAGRVKTWDVVNEIFNEDGTWRTSVFYNTIGESFVDIAFRAAEAADPNVGLAANEYNLDYGGAKVTAYINLVNNLKSRGVKITQIGSQSHLIVGSVPSASSLTSTFTAITATGVDLAVTELDIRMTLPVTDALLQQQKKDYNAVVLACMRTTRCVGVTIWTYSDYYSWIPSVFSGQGAALPWDDQLQTKPAFFGIADALQGVDDSIVTTTSTTSTPTSSTSSSTSSTATPTSTVLPLNDLAVAAGKKYFGTAVAINEYLNATYKVNLDNIHLFGQITPGNEMKWDATEGTRGVFSYTNADTIVSWALGNGKEVRGHTLVWHSQLPSWVTSGGFDNSTLVSILQNHVTNVVTHFSGKVKTWDVVNEIFNEDGTFRSTVFYNTIGEYFVDIAFRAAEAADPTVGLAANEYNLDYGGAKPAAYVTLVNNLKSRGVKITQVGSQSHLIVGSVPSASSLAATFASITATGVELAVTELDIRMTLPVTDALLLQQRKDYNNVILACMRTPGCIGMTIWAYSDYYSWIPSVFSGQGAALPWDDQLQPKPAFYGIADGLQNIDDSGLTITTTTTTTTSTTSTSSTSTTTVPSSTPSPLHDIAVAAGKEYFGTAVAYGEYLNATYKVNLDNIHLFGQMTPGNEMKWDATEGTRGVFTYTNADTMVAWALGNGKQIRGHTLVWHSQLPSWVSSGGFDNSTLVSILQNHVTNLVTHFSGKVKTWDVVNEIFNEDGTFRQSVFYTTIGEYYVDIAFRAAEAADPNVGLAANEYNLDYGGAKPAAYITLVNNLKSRGVKITQIGSQSHLIVGSVPSASSLTSTFTSITDTGVDLAVTELDIRMTLPVTDALLAQQKKDYNKVILACMNTPRCIGMTIWGYSDYYSWIPSVFSGQGAALPWDEQLQPKPAFYGIVDGLQKITST